MQCYSWLLIICLNFYLSGIYCHQEDECIEVGFARASFMNVEQGYLAAKAEVLDQWKKEDEIDYPKYEHLTPILKNITRAAALLELTSKNILKIIRKTRVGKRCPENWLLKGLEKHVTPLIQLDKDLAESLGLVMSFRCLVGSPFPNVDGTCLNEESPDMGAIGSKFLRLLPPVVGKEGFEMRSSTNKEKSLPSARKIAQIIRRHLKKTEVTALFTELSHFVALDTFNIPESPMVEGIDCCKKPHHTDCAPIIIDPEDSWHVKLKCLNFKRSIRAQAILGHRESLSSVSSYLDATPVYGPTNEEAFKRKEGYFGYLKYPLSLDHKMSSPRKSACNFPRSFKGCFDLFHEDKIFLENMSLLLLLEHNLIAELLAEINSHFDDALLYNEARRILIAEYNDILYGEMIPLLLGNESSEKHYLTPGSVGPGANFIPEVNPGILSSFALAAHWNPAMLTEWKSELGNSDILTPSHYASVRGDPYQDLLAMDIQRARDHGLPVYSTWKEFCDPGNQTKSWEDLEAVFSKEVVQDLKNLYQDEFEDLDLMVALLEPPYNGGIVGRTFNCILVDQFARLKTGNRLYWEHDSSMMTVEQREAIRSQISSAALLCRHFGLEKIPNNPFLEVSETNPEVDCNSFPKLNLTAWKDTSLIEIMKQKKEEEMGKKVRATGIDEQMEPESHRSIKSFEETKTHKEPPKEVAETKVVDQVKESITTEGAKIKDDSNSKEPVKELEISKTKEPIAEAETVQPHVFMKQMEDSDRPNIIKKLEL